MNQRTFLIGVLVLLGAAWGLTMPLSKIAVSDGYRHFGLIFWQFLVGAIAMAVLTLYRRKSLPLGGKQIRLYVIIALIGTILPNSASFESARHLPSGIISVLMSLIPMFAFPIALSLGIDRFNWTRLLGLLFGLAGVLLLVGPDASLPDPAMIAFIPLAMVAPFFYGVEGNIVAKWGTFGCDPVQVLLGASLVGAVITAPLAVMSGQWIAPHLALTNADFALLSSAVIHVFAYAGYVWLVGQSGSVFAAQVAYIVTVFGVFWAMVILGETYSNWVWLALGCIFGGLFLVLPRGQETALDANRPVGEDTT